MDSAKRRQEIYNAISNSSRDEYVLSEMKRLGFWANNEDKPSLPETLIKKEGELQREIQTLLAEKHKYSDKEQALIEMRQRRMAAAKEKRKTTKENKEKRIQEKAAKWATTKSQDIIYLGAAVSAGLQNKQGNPELLLSKNLPVFADVNALAAAMNINIGTLRFFSFHRKVATTTHYQRFTIPKKSGGKRLISAPMPKLKNLQYWILNNILDKIPVHDAANGFVKNRSILTNAQKHLNKKVLVNIDLKDFFPTVHFRRVKGLFVKIGYAEQIATILALICTEPEREELELDNQKYYLATGERYLPQGAPTSPAITNIVCYKMDKRFTALARQQNFTYTRYADDLSFSFDSVISSKEEIRKSTQSILWRIKKIIKEENFTIHPDKLSIMGKGSRQEVTGITVNKQPGINRKTLHRFRALVHQVEKEGFEGKKWKGGQNIFSEMLGYANFIEQVKPTLGKQYRLRLTTLMTPEIHAQIVTKTTKPTITHQIQTEPKTNPPKDWWNVL